MNKWQILPTLCMILIGFVHLARGQVIPSEPIRFTEFGAPFPDLKGKNVKEVIIVDYSAWLKDSAPAGSKTIPMRGEPYEKEVVQLDREGRPMEAMGSNCAAWDTQALTEEYEYDHLGRLVTHFRSDEESRSRAWARYEYDSLGRVVAFSQFFEGYCTLEDHQVTFHYRPDGLLDEAHGEGRCGYLRDFHLKYLYEFY